MRFGGVLLAVKNSIAVKPLSLPRVTDVVEVKLSSNKLLLVAVCYRVPDDHGFLIPFKAVVEIASSRKYAKVLIFGDFNYPKIRWVEGSGFVNNDVGRIYQHIV